MAPLALWCVLLCFGVAVADDATQDGKSCNQDVQCLLKALTLDEKLHFFAGDLDAIDHVPGVGRLGIPEINMGDGPNGVANTIPGTATSFPCNKAIGDTWDRNLTARYARAMAKEFKAKGKNMMLGPGVNLARVPQCGRMDEYIPGDDPTLGAELVKAHVKGALDENIMTNIKHFGNNEQETNRNQWSANPDANVNMEYYMKPFRAGVEAGAACLMCGYNKVNGLPACKNKDILHAAKRWGDSFWIVSDWGAIYPDAADGGAAEYINAGVDMEMGAHDDAECTGPDVPATKYGGAGYCNKGDYMLPDRMKFMLDSGKITEDRIDETVSRVLGALKTAGLLDSKVQEEFPPYVHKDYHSKWYGPLAQKDVRTQHSRQVAHEVATKAMVLVQNRDSLLPVSKTAKIQTYGCGDEVHFHAESGSASGTAPHFPKVPCQADGKTACPYPEDGLKAAGADVTAYKFSDGFNGPHDVDALTVVCLMAKSFNTEGTDRANLDMEDFPFKKFAKVVVWAVAPGPVILDFAPLVDSLLVSSLPGEMGGSAFTDIFFGKASPAGHLTLTMPNSMHETSVTVNHDSDDYAEGFEFGYRWYEAHNKHAIFGFGWGLSYAKYMQVPHVEFQAPAASERPSVKLQLWRDSDPADQMAMVDQVVQLYVQHKKPQARGFKELAGFGKVEGLKQKTAIQAVIEIDPPMIWDSKPGDKTAYDKSWVPVAEYTVFISLHGVEHARPLFTVKVDSDKYTAESEYNFDQDGPIKFDQELAVWDRSHARGIVLQKPAGHKWDSIPSASDVTDEFEVGQARVEAAASTTWLPKFAALALSGAVACSLTHLLLRRRLARAPRSGACKGGALSASLAGQEQEKGLLTCDERAVLTA